MKPCFSRSPGNARRQGMALVLVLFFIVIVTIIVVGFFESSQVDRAAASSQVERSRATSFAAEGIENVVALLRKETADPDRHWLSSPGRLFVPNPTALTGAGRYRIEQETALTSGLPSALVSGGDPVLHPPNLNLESFADPGSYLVTDQKLSSGAALPMNLRWVYVRRDGQGHSYDLPDPTLAISGTNLPNESPAVSAANPIVGRFAYWTDDESTKINYNLAWSREPSLASTNYNKSGPGHPTKIDLRALPGFSDEITFELHRAITPDKHYEGINRFFNSPFDARQAVGADARAALDLNKFNLTHFNSDPDTTYYGAPRMMLTTQLANAVRRDAAGNALVSNGTPLVRPFLDIVSRAPDSSESYIDPGILANIDPAKLSAVISNLVNNYLKRTDWPMVDGLNHSLQEKYYGAYPLAPINTREQRLAQLALNVIEYVRSAESRQQVVEPIRGTYTSGIFNSTTFSAGSNETFKGVVRAPCITEVGMWVSPTPDSTGINAGRYRTFVFVEIYLPPDYGIETLDLLGTDGKKWSLFVEKIDSMGGAAGNRYSIKSGGPMNPYYQVGKRASRDSRGSTDSSVFVWEALADPNKTTMRAGEYRTLTLECYRSNSPLASKVVPLRVALFLGAPPAGENTWTRIDLVPLSQAFPINYTLDVVASEMAVSSYETADPRVNGVSADWKRSDANSFGRVNNAWLASVGQAPLPSIRPEQDLDANGNVSAASLRMPYPFGHAKNPTGRVGSSGELGVIHTGIEGSNFMRPDGTSGGVPWRTLRLQPSRQGTDVVPDWAFMDLFTVPADVPQKALALFTPHSSSVGGRININAAPYPFNDLERLDPLAALFYNCHKNHGSNSVVSLAEAQAIARAIYEHKVAPAGLSLPAGKRYPASGLNVYESPGEIVEIEGVADRGEESERLVAEISNLITVRGNVFSVYSIGQALRQTPSGKLVVSAEQRQQAYIERYLIDKGTNDLGDDEVGFRTIYVRNLSP